MNIEITNSGLTRNFHTSLRLAFLLRYQKFLSSFVQAGAHSSSEMRGHHHTFMSLFCGVWNVLIKKISLDINLLQETIHRIIHCFTSRMRDVSCNEGRTDLPRQAKFDPLQRLSLTSVVKPHKSRVYIRKTKGVYTVTFVYSFSSHLRSHVLSSMTQHCY